MEETTGRAGQTEAQVHCAHCKPKAAPLFTRVSRMHTDSLFGFGQSDFLVPLVVLRLFERLGEAGDGLLELPLLSVDPLHVGRSELLVLELELELLVVVF